MRYIKLVALWTEAEVLKWTGPGFTQYLVVPPAVSVLFPCGIISRMGKTRARVGKAGVGSQAYPGSQPLTFYLDISG
jgi:hypothetical protein